MSDPKKKALRSDPPKCRPFGATNGHSPERSFVSIGFKEFWKPCEKATKIQKNGALFRKIFARDAWNSSKKK